MKNNNNNYRKKKKHFSGTSILGECQGSPDTIFPMRESHSKL